jgi:hypothetical protein
MSNPAVGILERNEFPHRDGVSRFGSMRLSDGSFLDIEAIYQAWAEGKGELETSRLRADSGQETDSVYFAMIYIGRMRTMIKQKNEVIYRAYVLVFEHNDQNYWLVIKLIDRVIEFMTAVID